jgi:hypothetical protein
MNTDRYPTASPTHQEIPYAFKPYAFEEAIEAGHRLIIWMDSAVWLNKPIEPLIEIIEEQGYLIFHNPWNNGQGNNGQWCNDRSLYAFGLKREGAKKTKHIMACVMGFDIDNPTGHKIFSDWASRTDLYHGKWDNRDRTESQDFYCRGHRHDQSVLSLVAWAKGAKITPTKGLIDYDVTQTDSILLTQGM